MLNSLLSFALGSTQLFDVAIDPFEDVFYGVNGWIILVPLIAVSVIIVAVAVFLIWRILRKKM